MNGVSVALSSTGINGVWEIGLRKSSGDSSTSKDTYGRIKATFEHELHEGIGCDKLCEGETWWYWYDEFQSQEVAEVEIERKLRALYGLAEQIGNS